MIEKRISSTHSFDIQLARDLGSPDLAIILHHINYWIEFNERSGKNYYENKFWMYQTLEEIGNHFPYWKINHIRTLLDKLVKMGILIKGNFNKMKMDRTVWYTIDFKIISKICENPQMHMCESTNPDVKIHTPIPDTKTNTKNRESSRENPSLEKNKIPSKLYGKFVKLTDEEYSTLCKKESQEKVDAIIEEINDHCVNNRPKGYDDYTAAFRTFLRNKNKTEGKQYAIRNKGRTHKSETENLSGVFINGKRVE